MSTKDLLPHYKASQMLWMAHRHTEGDVEALCDRVTWTVGDVVVARGLFGEMDTLREIVFPATDDYAETTFKWYDADSIRMHCKSADGQSLIRKLPLKFI